MMDCFNGLNSRIKQMTIEQNPVEHNVNRTYLGVGCSIAKGSTVFRY
jgi:hypothetical protein